jgi:hypothetical protein
MGYDMLIGLLDQLPEDKKKEVYDFALFIAQYQPETSNVKSSRRSLVDKIKSPLMIDGFTPFSREEAHAR